MAISYLSEGAASSGTGALTVALPTTRNTDDILLLVVETANQAVTVNTSGWTQVSASPQGTGTAAGTAATRLTVYYRIVDGSETNVSIADSGDHQVAQIICYTGVDPVNPINAIAGSVKSTASTSVTYPSVTTTVDNCRVLLIEAHSLPDSNSTAIVSGHTNSNLSNILEQLDQNTNAGNGGGFSLAGGDKDTAGSTGTSTATLSTSAVQGMITLALAPLTLPELTGSLDATETGSDSFSASGDVIVEGSLSASETGADTFSATGTVTDAAIAGNLVVTETGTDTFSSTGDVIVQGALSVSETGNDTFSASGDVIVKGSLSVTETGTDSFSATGSALLVATGSLDATEANDTLSASGTVLIKGVITALEIGSDTFTSIGVTTEQRSGSMSATEASDFLGSYVVDNYVESGYSISGWEGFVYYEIPLPSTVTAGVRYGPNGAYVGTATGGGTGTRIEITSGKIVKLVGSTGALLIS